MCVAPRVVRGGGGGGGGGGWGVGLATDLTWHDANRNNRSACCTALLTAAVSLFSAAEDDAEKVAAALHAFLKRPDVDGNTATVIDLDVGLNWQLVDLGGTVLGAITVGYKSFDIDVEYDDGASGSVDLDLAFTGPYFGITLTL